MHFNANSLVALALAATAYAAPAAEPMKLTKRDTCVFIGTWRVEAVVGGGGPGQGPVSYTYGTLSIQYEGGVNISPAIGGNQANFITNDPQTFQPDQTRLPQPITWSADFDIGYKSCTVVYEGQTYHGGPANPGSAPAGTSAYQCNVSFGCEGGISKLPGSK